MVVELNHANKTNLQMVFTCVGIFNPAKMIFEEMMRIRGFITTDKLISGEEYILDKSVCVSVCFRC